MTELQIMINELKTRVEQALNLVARLEKQQKDLRETKEPEFPSCFIVVKDRDFDGNFVIGLQKPCDWRELPQYFVGRAGYDRDEIQQIIRGLQTLLGESNDRTKENNY